MASAAQILGVTVALDDLGRRGRGGQAEVAAHLLLELRVHVGKAPHRPRQLADRDGGSGPGAGARGCGRPPTYQTATLRPKVMGSACTPCVRAHHHACPGGEGPGPPGSRRRRSWPAIRRSAASRSCRAVAVSHTSDDVKPDMDEARVLPEVLLEVGEQRDHLVLDPSQDLLDPSDVDARLRLDSGQRLGRDATSPPVGLAHGQLRRAARPAYLDSSLQIRPMTGTGVALDHGRLSGEGARVGDCAGPAGRGSSGPGAPRRATRRPGPAPPRDGRR